MNTYNKSLVIKILLIAAPILIAQAIWIYNDAKKRGSKHYFLWGIFGLHHAPGALIMYILVTRIIFKKK